MRFAISLLVFISIASLLGTVLIQNRPASVYIDQFGPFWYEVFKIFSIDCLYSSAWFLITMAFLVLSVTVCLIRNGPKMFREARSYREYLRAASWSAFPHRFEKQVQASAELTTMAIGDLLTKMGYSVRRKPSALGQLVAAKKGSANRLGYIFSHAAIIVICIGGLLDSELFIRLQIWFNHKIPLIENSLITEVPASGRLSVNNPSFRASMLLPEGSQTDTAIVRVGQGALIQPLPFTLVLKNFLVEYYSTGMPSRFASQVKVIDPTTHQSFETTIEVNHPLRFKGLSVYQASFEDGGSTVTLTGYPLVGLNMKTFKVSGTIGKTVDIQANTVTGQKTMRLELTDLRPINIEDISDSSTSARQGNEHVASVTSPAVGKKNKVLRNMGPSISYRLIDDSGQAYEFQNYMLPVNLAGMNVFLAGLRLPSDPTYRYLRLPVDDDHALTEFMRLRAILADPQARLEAAGRVAQKNKLEGLMQTALQTATQRALNAFATGGLKAVSEFLQANTPASELQRTAEVVIRLIGAGISELRDIARERAGLGLVATQGEAAQRATEWLQLAIGALSDLSFYPAPIFLSLDHFQPVQASVFQVSRSPGQNLVYLGCVLLILGIFSLFYIRDRRIWVWISAENEGQTSSLRAAMTSQKRQLDFYQEFEAFKQAVLSLKMP